MIGYPMWSSAAVADGAVFVGYRDGTLYAFGSPPLQTPPTVMISPQNITSFRLNDNFTVYVQVDNATAIDAAQVQFTYDPTVLSVTQVVEGPFLPSAGPTIVAQAYAEENLTSEPPTGEVFYLSTITGSAALTGASGSGVLLNVTFRVVSEGVTPLHLLFYRMGTGGAGTYFLNNESSEIGPKLRDASFQTAPIGPIHIKADGSIEPKEIRAHIPISTVDNVTYTFTGDIEKASIVVERDNVTVDGAGYTLQTDWSGANVGFTLSNLRNVTIKNTKIIDFDIAIYLESTFQSVISGNTITGYWSGTDRGIALYSSSNNSIVGNNATQIRFGVGLYSSSDRNNITHNTFTNCVCGMEIYHLYSSCNNSFYNNNFIGSLFKQVLNEESLNTWDNGYPSGGNYWSNYKGTDLYSGPYQNVTGSDGIGDTPYVIDANNTDDYPLMGAFSDFNVARGVDVQVVSNSIVSDFQFNGTAILFNVSGVNGTTGFCNVRVPTALLNGTLTVLVNGIQVQYNLLPISDSSNRYLYFTYSHSTEQVIIMPEFSLNIVSIVLLPFAMATLCAAIMHRKHYLSPKQKKKSAS
jgi:parallel beta-helix repeat protein